MGQLQEEGSVLDFYLAIKFLLSSIKVQLYQITTLIDTLAA